MGKFVVFVVVIVLGLIGFYAGYQLTDFYFQIKMVPYPFEKFGIAVGVGLGLWIAALTLFIQRRFR